MFNFFLLFHLTSSLSEGLKTSPGLRNNSHFFAAGDGTYNYTLTTNSEEKGVQRILPDEDVSSSEYKQGNAATSIQQLDEVFPNLIVPDIVGQILLFIALPLNLIALTYFVSRSEDGPNKIMFITLTTTDIIISSYLVGAFKVVRETRFYIAYMFRVFDNICYVSTFITCQICVVRVIVLTHPLLRIKSRYVIGSLFLFLVLQVLPYLVTKGYFFSNEDTFSVLWNGYYATIAVAITVTAVISSITCVVTLRQSRDTVHTKRKRKATITAIALTVTFLIFNIPYYILLIIYLDGQIRGKITETDLIFTMNMLYTQIGMQLNSVTNSIIYFVRISEMREFLLRCLGYFHYRRLSLRFSSSRVINSTPTTFTLATFKPIPATFKPIPATDIPIVLDTFKSSPVDESPVELDQFKSGTVAETPIVPGQFKSSPVAESPVVPDQFESSPVAETPILQNTLASSPTSESALVYP